MDKKMILELLARKMAGEATPDEMEQLEELLASYPETIYYEELLNELWQQPLVARWEAAQDEAKAVVDLGTGYKLNLSAPVSTEEGRVNYKSIAMGGGSKAPGIDASAASELILARYFIDLSALYFGRANAPNGYHN